MNDTETVRTGKQKQEIPVADQSTTAKVTLWKEQAGSLKEGISYQLEGVKYLSFGGESKITPIDDIECVKICDNEKTIIDVAIMAVAQLECYKACLCCNARVEAVDDTDGMCSKVDCGMLQKLGVLHWACACPVNVVSRWEISNSGVLR